MDPAGETRDLVVETADGRDRTAHLYVPASLRGEAPVSLLVALHGGTGWGRQFEENSGYDRLAEANRFLVVYPDGVGAGPNGDTLRTWNGGVCCGRAARESVDDVAFLRQLVDDISTQYRIDRDRVYATGHSNGMIMSYRLVCEAADVFVAAAGQAGTLGVEDCDPSQPISMLHIHGTADTNLPIDGGRGEGISGVDFPAPRRGIRTLAEANDCPTSPATDTQGPATTETWEPCAAGTAIVFASVSGASHSWMGAEASPRPGAPEVFPDYDSSLEAWTFLAIHARNE